MGNLSPKMFIEKVFVSELEELSKVNHYISFAIMAIGIEFLGKCLDKKAKNWNLKGKSKQNFYSALESLKAFDKYKKHKQILYKDLRCGFAHSFLPGINLSLSSKNETGNLLFKGNRLNLRCEDFYSDFRKACEELVSKDFVQDDKMNKDFIYIPGDNFNATVDLKSAITGSIKI